MSKKNKRPETPATDATPATPATPATSATDATDATGATSEADAAKAAEKARERAASATDGLDGMLNRFILSLIGGYADRGEGFPPLSALGFEQVEAFGSKVIIHRDQTVFRRISAVARNAGYSVKARLIENMGEKLRIIESVKRDAS